MYPAILSTKLLYLELILLKESTVITHLPISCNQYLHYITRISSRFTCMPQALLTVPPIARRSKRNLNTLSIFLYFPWRKQSKKSCPTRSIYVSSNVISFWSYSKPIFSNKPWVECLHLRVHNWSSELSQSMGTQNLPETKYSLYALVLVRQSSPLIFFLPSNRIFLLPVQLQLVGFATTLSAGM